MEMNFCRRCGSPLLQESQSSYICENRHTIYVNAASAAGIFFLTGANDVLMSVRGVEPFKGALDSFGGFIDDGETVEAALTREIKEELGLSPEQYEAPVFLSTETGLYPYQSEERSILSTFFWSRLKDGAVPVPADDVAAIKQIALSDINLSEMDNSDVRAAVQKLQALFL